MSDANASWLEDLLPSNVIVRTSVYTVPVVNTQVVALAAVGITVTLPAAPVVGQTVIVKDLGFAGSGASTVRASGGHKIDGSSTYDISLNYASVVIVYTGINWSVIGYFPGTSPH